MGYPYLTTGMIILLTTGSTHNFLTLMALSTVMNYLTIIPLCSLFRGRLCDADMLLIV